MNHLTSCLAAAAIACLSACATTYSQLDGKPFSRVDYTLFPVQVTKVDGRSTTGNPVLIEPGMRKVTLLAPPEKYGRFGDEQTIEVDVGVCERVVFGAQRPSRLLIAWQPVIVERLPVPGCVPSQAKAPRPVPAGE
jgi:hypothetical protein